MAARSASPIAAPAEPEKPAPPRPPAPRRSVGLLIGAVLVGLAAGSLITGGVFALLPSRQPPAPPAPTEPAPKEIEKLVPPKLADVPGLLKRESLKGALKSPEADTRRATVTALGEAGQRLSESVGDLTDSLEDGDPPGRAFARVPVPTASSCSELCPQH